MAGYIDHTLLRAEATAEDIRRLCREAKEYNFYAVCVNPSYVRQAARALAGSGVRLATVIGFPLGATTTAVKAFETAEAVAAGAAEVDMVIHLGALKSGDIDYVRKDINTVVSAAEGKTVKVIIEAALLSDNEKILACRLAGEAGAQYVKTSTGFGPGGATVADVRLMRETVGPAMGVKAAGGVRTAENARRMIEAGASRIGTSAGKVIISQ
ncbi:MAG TPA: deoxyribose-phosphate aldolase [Firmicutes bacterium]|nr:deoxyribose-phosphate aldolase [Bacillota bacterium]